MKHINSPTRVVICCAPEDRELRARLETHLNLLVRNRVIIIWHDGRVLPGQHRRSVVDSEIQNADIILLLVSASFLQCDDCYDLELPLALTRHSRGEALVIPIHLRPVAWEGASFAELQPLPANGLAVTLWKDIDEALRDIVLGLTQVLVVHASGESPSPSMPQQERCAPSNTRRVDAAIPAGVTVGESTEVLAMITTSSSDGLRVLLRLDPLSFQVAPEDVRSSQFELPFPVDARGQRQAATVTVVFESRDFNPPLLLKKILVPPAFDSTVCTLFVTPTRSGTLPIQLDVRLGDVTISSQRLRTNASDAGAPRARGYLLTSVPLSTTSYPPIALPPKSHRIHMDSNTLVDLVDDVVAASLQKEARHFQRSGRDVLERLHAGETPAGATERVEGAARSGAAIVIVPKFVKVAMAILVVVRWLDARAKRNEAAPTADEAAQSC